MPTVIGPMLLFTQSKGDLNKKFNSDLNSKSNSVNPGLTFKL